MTLTHLGDTSDYSIKSTPKEEWGPFDFIDTESGWAVIAKRSSPEEYAAEGRYIWKKWDQPRSAFSLPPTDGSPYGFGAELTRDGRYLEGGGVLFPSDYTFGLSTGHLDGIPEEMPMVAYFGPVDPTRGLNHYPPARTDFDTILLADGNARKWTRVDMELDWKYDTTTSGGRGAPGAIKVILDEREYAMPGFQPWHKQLSETYINKAPTYLREGSSWRLATLGHEAVTIDRGMETWHPAEVEYGLSPRFLVVMAVVDPGVGVEPVSPKTMVGVLDRETGSFKSTEIAGHVRTGAVIRGVEAIFYVDETSPRPGQPFDTGYTRIAFRLDTLSHKRGVRKEGTLLYGPATPSYMTDVPQLVEFVDPDVESGYRRVLRMDSDEVAVLGQHISISGYTIVLRNYPTISRQTRKPAASWVELVAWRPDAVLGMKDQRSDGYFS